MVPYSWSGYIASGWIWSSPSMAATVCLEMIPLSSQLDNIIRAASLDTHSVLQHNMFLWSLQSRRHCSTGIYKHYGTNQH